MRHQFDNKDIVFDKVCQKESAVQVQPKSVLEAFEYIVELAENTNLNTNFFDKAAIYIKYASHKLKLSSIQTVLLALFVDRSETNSIRISEIASYSGCRTTKILRLSSEIDVLEEKRYLRASRSRNSLSYRVPADVLNSLKKNQPYIQVEEHVKDLQTFFERFNDLMEEMNEDETTHDVVLAQTKEYLSEIKDIYFVRTLKRLNLREENELLFIFMAHLFVENNDDCIGFSDIDDLYDNDIPCWCKSELRGHASNLFEHNLIENVNEDGMARSDLNLTVKSNSDYNLIKPDSFLEKKDLQCIRTMSGRRTFVNTFD